MDENFDNNATNNGEENNNGAPDVNENNIYNADNAPLGNDDINNFTMDESGKIRTDRGGAAVLSTSSKMYVVLGWISAALTAFISPYFAVLGIVFGVLANRQARGSGNAVIITNVVLAAINIIFGLFLVTALRRLFIGF